MASRGSPGFRPDIQGLRAVAVFAVLGFHAGVPGFGGGLLGVDVFYVISGYLIGGQLVRGLFATGRVDFAGFYARRARRILPAALTVIVLTVIAALLLVPPLRFPEILGDAAASALSVVNIRFALEQTDYLAGLTPSPFQHYWSLAVEEQFYLIVPLVLLALWALTRRSKRWFAAAVGVLAVGSLVTCLVMGTSSPWTFFSLQARAWELAVGVLIAIAAPRLARLGMRVSTLIAGTGAVLLLAGFVASISPDFPHPGIGTALPVLGTAALIAAGEGEQRSIISRVLGIRPAVAIGTISYSLYLVHWPMLALAAEGIDPPGTLSTPAKLLLVLAAVPVAWLLYRFVEQPFLSGRRWGGMPSRRSLIAGGVAIATIAGSLIVAAPVVAAVPIASSRSAADTPLSPLPAGTAYVPSNLHPTLVDAVADTGELYSDGCQQSTSGSKLIVCSFGPADGAVVVLFGDSHAGRWFPALRAAFADQPVRLVTLTKSGCRSVETEDAWAGAQNRSCAAWRETAIEWLTKNPPQLIVLANHLGRPMGNADAFERKWQKATGSSLARLPASSHLVVVAETPEFAFSPPVCLSRHLDDATACALSRTIAVNQAAITAPATATAAAGGTFLDLTDLFCNAQDCPVVIGATLVYTDTHHLSATFSSELGPAVGAVLLPLLD